MKWRLAPWMLRRAAGYRRIFGPTDKEYFDDAWDPAGHSYRPCDGCAGRRLQQQQLAGAAVVHPVFDDLRGEQYRRYELPAFGNRQYPSEHQHNRRLDNV